MAGTPRGVQVRSLALALLLLAGCATWAPTVPSVNVQTNAVVAADGSTNGFQITTNVVYVVNPAWQTGIGAAQAVNAVVPSPYQPLIDGGLKLFAGVLGAAAAWQTRRANQ